MATGVQWSGTQFSSGDRAYFVSVAHHPDAGGDEGSVDLALTDGEAAWTAAGLTSDALTGAARGKMAHLLAAVTELREAEPGIQYTCSAKPQGDGSMVLQVEWKPPGAAFALMLGARLAPSLPAAPTVAAMLRLLVANLQAAQTAAADTLQQLGEYEKQATRCQALVDQYVETKAAQDKETNSKVAALLNSKKQKLRELQAELKAAQEEIARLREGGGGGGGEAMDADDEGGEAGVKSEDEDMGGQQAGGSGPAQRPAQQGRTRVKVEDEGEDDDSSGGGYETDPEGLRG